MYGKAFLIRNETQLLQSFEVGTRRSFERLLYKQTSCGAWIEWQTEGVLIGSIVEGSDAEVTADLLRYPFTDAELVEAIDYVEETAEELWLEANDEEF